MVSTFLSAFMRSDRDLLSSLGVPRSAVTAGGGVQGPLIIGNKVSLSSNLIAER